MEQHETFSVFTGPTSGSQVDFPTGKTSTTPDGLSALLAW